MSGVAAPDRQMTALGGTVRRLERVDVEAEQTTKHVANFKRALALLKARSHRPQPGMRWA